MLRLQGVGNGFYQVAEMAHGKTILLANTQGYTELEFPEALELIEHTRQKIDLKNRLDLMGNRAF